MTTEYNVFTHFTDHLFTGRKFMNHRASQQDDRIRVSAAKGVYVRCYFLSLPLSLLLPRSGGFCL